MSGTPFRPLRSIREVLGGELERRIDDALVDVVGAEVSVTSMDIVYA